IYWFWGDTAKMAYPLGHFWMAGATSDLPGRGGLDPAVGVNLRYFVDKDGFSRPMCRLGVQRGPIWADCFAVLSDDTGRQHLVCHYVHVESLGKILDHGLAVYNDKKEEFERLKDLGMADLWRFPQQAHPIRHRDGGVEYLYLGEIFPIIRVPARLSAFTDLDSYEAWTCLAEGSTPDNPKVKRDARGELRYRWARGLKPITVDLEQKLVASGLIKPDETRLSPRDVDSGKPVKLHRGSVCWNEHRKRWILIACEVGGSPSHLGEIWYSESASLTGPWRLAKKIVSHNQYSFYNPVQHPFFDQAGGRYVYFEGTYAVAFSGNKHPTPRYEYNQVMYRLDLDDPRLKAVQEAS
ncbi:MAG: hypothetical protein ACUVTZ_08130, partial [Armatimonadota bacterium]